MKSTHAILEYKVDPLLTFNNIYQAAKEKNTDKLTQALSLASINVFNGNDPLTSTPIAKLAFENDERSVKFLLDFKATPQEPAKLQATYGYAIAKNIKNAYAFINELRKEEEKHHDTIPAVLYYMAEGFSVGGHKAEAYSLLEKVKNVFLTLDHSACTAPVISGMISGFIKGGRDEQAYAIYEEAKNIPSNIPTAIFFNNIVLGFAYIGKMSKIYEGIEELKNESPNKINSLLIGIAFRLGLRGYVEEFNKFLKKMNEEHPAHIQTILMQMLKGLASGGHITKAKVFFKKVKSEYPDLIPSLLYMWSFGLADRGHKAEAYSLLQSIQNTYPNETESVLKAITWGEKYSRECIDRTIFLRTLTMFESPAIRERIATELKSPIKNFDTLSLLPQATKHNEFRIKQNLTYNQLLGWRQPEISIFMLQGIALVHRGKLTADSFLLIVTFLSAMTSQEVLDLSNKFALHICKDRFFKNLMNQDTLLMLDKAMSSKSNTDVRFKK